MRTSLVVSASLLASAAAAAPLSIGTVRTDRPTIHALGVQVLISGDEDRDATIAVRYRPVGETSWRDGPPLFRVKPETVAVTVPEQFAGSIFDLAPGTSYEIELSATDPDGAPLTRTVTAATRAIPRDDPDSPNVVNVSDATQLRAALSGAAAGDVIVVANGTYTGSFSISVSGTAARPIVIRGESASGAILDGAGCTGCNVLEVYGSYVHVERLTMRNAVRALRFLGGGAVGNVARRLLIKNVVHGIGAATTEQNDFYICDNDIDGRLVWPWVFASDATSHWDDRGVHVIGDGHVVCHNRIRGFGDPVVNKKSEVRSWDVYGNDIADSYDGTELDEGQGNVRLFRNRFTNVMAPVSIQPVYGGPAYVLRNVLFNVPDEQIKLKSLGGTLLPSGAVIQHNTFVSPKLALNLQTPITQYNFVISNNLFVGPRTLTGTRVVDWTATIEGGVFDYNGYFPDGSFWFGRVGGVNRVYSSFSAAQASGEVETHGVLLSEPVFGGALVGPTDQTARHDPPSFVLAAGSSAIDRGGPLPGINGGHQGFGPDLGAIERGCPEPTYGPRPEGSVAVAPVDCSSTTEPPDGGTPVDGGGTVTDAGGDPDGGEARPDGGVGQGGDGGATSDGGDELGATGGCSCGASGAAGAFTIALLALLSARVARRRAGLSARSPAG